MLLTLLTAAIKALSDSFIQAIFGLIQQEMHDRGLIQQGQAQQAAKETATAEATEASMAQAIADSPKTKADALKRLEGGTA